MSRDGQAWKRGGWASKDESWGERAGTRVGVEVEVRCGVASRDEKWGGRVGKRGRWVSKEERSVASKDEYIVFYSRGHVDTKNL